MVRLMRQRLTWMLVMLAVGMNLVCAGDNQPIEIGRLRFHGNRTFSDDQLRTALRGSTEFWIANHPQNNAAQLPSTIAEQLRRGYREAGFRSPVLDVTPDEDGDSWECVVKEGERYRYGSVRIKNAVQADRRLLTERLTRPYPDPDAFPTFSSAVGTDKTIWIDEQGEPSSPNRPVWQQGHPVRFDSLDHSRDRLIKQVQTALSEVGLPDADFRVLTEFDETDRTVDLVVEVLDEGAPSRIQAIEFVGLKRNSEQTMLDYLQVSVGDPYREETRHHLSSLLWKSARFGPSRVKYDSSSGTLTIEVVESEGLPTIDQPIGVVGATLLKSRQWLGDCYRRGEDTQFDVPIGPDLKVQLTMSADGIAVQSQRWVDSAWTSGTVMLIDDRCLLVSAREHPEKLLIDITALDGQVAISTLLGAATDSDRVFRFLFAGKLTSERDPGESKLVHRWSASPNDWLMFSTKSRLHRHVEDGQLQVFDQRYPDLRFDVDCNTGAIRNGPGTDALRFGPGLFQQASTGIRQVTDAKPNAYSPQKPLSTIVSYFLADPMVAEAQAVLGEGPVGDLATWRSLKKLVDHGVLAIPDAAIASFLQDRPDESFSIPLTETPPDDWQSMLVDYGAKLVLQQASVVFTEEQWPIRVIRECCLIALRRGDFSGQVISDLATDPEVGPLGHASIAFLLDCIGQDAKRLFAQRALMSFTRESFQKDWDTLLPAMGHQVIRETVESFASLDPDEFEALVKPVTNPRLVEVLRMIRHHALLDPTDQAKERFQLSRVPLTAYLESLTR
ncbi:hypothetical protein FYK55_25770 [Roseiconus nitratireducens]|uniref:POTRA domain-containing protein n=1 Tax=Roseiconus nitratireducens TaxID=2605748 RepID=A0A5M6CUS9_9BACT|nr:hypothetical protein [Roseiconus nitratireducens]KAA5539007.1 hypothetical protein FYK55_25770 [Roseiconus nitratireducens]